MAGQVILAIAYGIDIAPHGDRNVEVAEKAVGAIIAGSRRGRIFDLFPFRKFGPNFHNFNIAYHNGAQWCTCPGGSLAQVSKRKRKKNGRLMSRPHFTRRTR